MVKIGGIALVGVDVDLQLAGGVGPDKQVPEDRVAGTGDCQTHPVAVFHAKVIGVGVTHMDVSLGSDHPLLQFDRSSWADQHAAGGAGDLAAGPHR